MTQPPGAGQHVEDPATPATDAPGSDQHAGDGFSAATSHYSSAYAGLDGASTTDTNERSAVRIDEGDDDGFGPATISSRAAASTDTPPAESAPTYAGPSSYDSSYSAHTDGATTSYDSPTSYGMSGTAVHSAYGSYTPTPAAAATAAGAGTGTTAATGAATTGTAARAARARGPRRASLQLRHINPWTVLKFSCVLAIALFFVWLIIVGVLFGILDAAGVVGKINETATTINGPGSKDPITVGVVFGGAALVGVVNVILFIALSTVGSIIYNLCADLVGGVEVTLSET